MAQNELGNLHYTLGVDDKDFNETMRLAKEKLKSFEAESQKLLSVKIRMDSNINAGVIKSLSELTGKTNDKAKADANAALAAQRLSSATLNQAKVDEVRARQVGQSALMTQRLATEAERTATAHQRLENASRKVADSQKKLNDWAAFTNKTLTNQKVIAYQLANALGTTFSVYAVGAFVNKLAQVRGEFELQQVAIRAIIRDKQAADKIFSQVKSLAVESPFQFKDLVRDTKQLAAFSIETDKLFDTTKRLADISAGLGVDMGRIVLAYGQVKAATVLRGQELRQFTEAGIGLVDKLAERFSNLEGKTVSAGDVFERISNRMVSFKDVDQIFTDMTSSGGMFFEMQKKQADTLYGKISNLKDAYALMLNSIGEANDGLLKGGVNAISSLIKNWDKVASILKVVIATYGTYKAISISAAAIDRVRNAIIKEYIVLAKASAAQGAIMSRGMLLSAARTNVLAGSFTKLKAAMLANPITAIVVGMTALGLAVYEVGKRYEWFSSNVEKAASSSKRLQDAISQMPSSKIDKLVSTYESLSSKINRSAAENELLKQTIKAIGLEVPDAIKKLDEYGNAVELNMKKVTAMTKAERDARNEQLKNELSRSEKTYNALKSEESRLQALLDKGKYVATSGGTSVEVTVDKDRVLASINEVRKAYEDLEPIIISAKKELGLFKPTVADSNKLSYNIKQLSSEILKLSKYGQAAKTASDYVKGSQDIKTATDGIIERYNSATEAAERMSVAKDGLYTKKQIADAKNEAELYKVIKEQILGIYDKSSTKAAKDEEDKYADAVKNRIDLIKQAKQQYEELSRVYGKTTAAAVVTKRFAEIPDLQLDGDRYKAQFTKAISDLAGHTSASAIALQNSLVKDVKDIEQKGMIQPFEKALENFQRFVEENQDKFNLYQRILEATGSESKAIELSFGLKTDSVDVESVMKKQVTDAAIKLQSEGGFKFDFEMNYDNLVKNIDTLPDKIRPSIQKIEDFVKEKSSNALIGRLNMLVEQMPDGMGLQFDFSRVLSQLDKDINAIQNKSKLLSFGATPEEINVISSITKKATSAQKEIYRQRVAEMGRAYIEENLMNKQLWASYTNLGDASITELSAMQIEFANMQQQLLSGSGLQQLTGTLASSQVGSILGQLGSLSDINALRSAVNSMLADIQLGQQNIITVGSSTTVVSPDEVDRLNIVLTLIKSIAENVGNAQRRVNDTSLDKRLASFKKLHSNIVGTIKSVNDLSDAMGIDLPPSVSAVLDTMNAAADGITGVMDALRSYQQATQDILGAGTRDVIANIQSTSQAASGGVQAASSAAAASIKAVESASVILAIIGAALAVATAIGNAIAGSQKEKAESAIRNQKRLLDSLTAAYDEVQKAADKFYNLDIHPESSERWVAREKHKIETWYKHVSPMYKKLFDRNSYYEKLIVGIEQKGASMTNESVLDFQLKNLKLQQEALDAQITAAQGDNKKGKRDSEIEGYYKEIDNISAKIAEIQDRWYDTLRGTDLKSAASDFAEAWVDAFLMGENAMDSFSGKFDEVMKNMILKQAASRVMSKVLQPLFKQIDQAIGTSGELNVDEVKGIVSALPGIMTNLDAGMKAIIQPLLEAAGLTAGSGKTLGGLEGEIKGVSEDTARLLASLLNAVRADVSMQTSYILDIKTLLSNTQNSIALSLTYLAKIDANTYDLLQSFRSVVGGRGSQGDGIRVWA